MSHAAERHDFRDKARAYEHLAQELGALLAGERDTIANAANTAALIFGALPQVNWAGFYFLRDGELVVGPFQGQPACVRIALGQGVCGTAAAERRTNPSNANRREDFGQRSPQVEKISATNPARCHRPARLLHHRFP
jgi:putative methionine-R-sulfoxide reductase with GAF domain